MKPIKTFLTYLRSGLLALLATAALGFASLSGPAAPAAGALGFAALLSLHGPADAALSMSTALRTARAQAYITQAGAGAKLKLYNGTRPAAVGAVTGGNTLLATVTFGSTIGTATAGTLDFDEAGATQSSGSHVSGTPTFADITTSADVVVMRIDIGAGAGNWQFTGTVTTGVNITLTTLVITEGNAS